MERKTRFRRVERKGEGDGREGKGEKSGRQSREKERLKTVNEFHGSRKMALRQKNARFLPSFLSVRGTMRAEEANINVLYDNHEHDSYDDNPGFLWYFASMMNIKDEGKEQLLVCVMLGLFAYITETIGMERANVSY